MRMFDRILAKASDASPADTRLGKKEASV